jgi:2-dehydro-3-deoxygalactonokinase
MKGTSLFLSCDWGTSSFRLRLVNAENYQIIAERVSKDGNAKVFEKWLEEGKPEKDRVTFYLAIVREQVRDLEKEQGGSLTGLPLVISGMASSTIGMTELPYKKLPFKIDGSDLKMLELNGGPDLKNSVFLISGAKTDDDVMRGEETQLVGCMLKNTDQEQLFIHPGTHSKHIFVKSGTAVSFNTYMTGELFSVLSRESILASSVKQGKDFQDVGNWKSFEKGVVDALNGNLLHKLFMVRTNDLFRKITPVQNSFYLSGLLIATELTAFPKDFRGRVILAGEELLVNHYRRAIEIMRIDRSVSELIVMNADLITVRGQFAIFNKHRSASR